MTNYNIESVANWLVFACENNLEILRDALISIVLSNSNSFKASQLRTALANHSDTFDKLVDYLFSRNVPVLPQLKINAKQESRELLEEMKRLLTDNETHDVIIFVGKKAMKTYVELKAQYLLNKQKEQQKLLETKAKRRSKKKTQLEAPNEEHDNQDKHTPENDAQPFTKTKLFLDFDNEELKQSMVTCHKALLSASSEYFARQFTTTIGSEGLLIATSTHFSFFDSPYSKNRS